MSPPALSYTLLERPLYHADRDAHLLLTFQDTAPSQEASSQGSKSAQPDEWVIATSGALSSRSAERIAGAWMRASSQERLAVILGRDQGESPQAQLRADLLTTPCAPLSAQLKRRAQQAYSFEETDTTIELDLSELSETPTPSALEANSTPYAPDLERQHLLLCLTKDNSVAPPNERDLSHYVSLTLWVEETSVLLWPWLQWAARLGARVIGTRDEDSALLTELINAASHREHTQITLRPAPQGKLSSVVSLNSPLGSLTIDGVTSFKAPLLRPHERAAWLVSVRAPLNGEGDRLLLRCDVGGARCELKDRPSMLASNVSALEYRQPAVAFAQELSARTQALELALNAYLRHDLRRVVQALDRWVKLTLSLEGEEAAREIHMIKVKLLHLGRLDTQDLTCLINAIQTPLYTLSAAGQWTRA